MSTGTGQGYFLNSNNPATNVRTEFLTDGTTPSLSCLVQIVLILLCRYVIGGLVLAAELVQFSQTEAATRSLKVDKVRNNPVHQAVVRHLSGIGAEGGPPNCPLLELQNQEELPIRRPSPWTLDAHPHLQGRCNP